MTETLGSWQNEAETQKSGRWVGELAGKSADGEAVAASCGRGFHSGAASWLPLVLFQVRLVDKDLLKFLNLEELVLSANQIQEVDAVNLPPTLKVKEPRSGLRVGAAQPRARQSWATFLQTCSFRGSQQFPL